MILPKEMNSLKKMTTIPPVETPAKRKKLRVAAYCRVSTASDAQLESLDTQRSYYKNYINARSDWELTDIYFDEGITGTKMNQRGGLLKLLADCESRQIDLVVTKSLSRLFRNTTDCLEIVRRLQELNIPIYFEKENLNTQTMESELLLSIMSSLAQDESASTSKNIKWSIRQRFKKGNYKLSYPPYGYDWDGKELRVNPEQASVVKEIFADYLAGKSVSSVIQKLNNRGILTKRKNKWQHATITNILINEKYTGDAIFQKTYTDDSYKKKVNIGERDQYFYAAHHDAIISHESFAQAQKLLAQHRQEKGVKKGDPKHNNHYAFSGKIICNECGATLRRRIHASTGNRYVAWCCNTHIQDKNACSMLYIRNDQLEAAFAAMINKLIYARKIILTPLIEKMKIYSADDNIHRIRELETELMKITEQKHILQRLMAEKYLDQIIFTQQSNELQTQANTYNKELKALQKNGGKSTEQLMELKRLLYFTLHTPIQHSFKESFFEEYAVKVIIYNRQEVGFQLKCGLILRERI